MDVGEVPRPGASWGLGALAYSLALEISKKFNASMALGKNIYREVSTHRATDTQDQDS